MLPITTETKCILSANEKFLTLSKKMNLGTEFNLFYQLIQEHFPEFDVYNISMTVGNEYHVKTRANKCVKLFSVKFGICSLVVLDDFPKTDYSVIGWSMILSHTTEYGVQKNQQE